MNISYKLDKDKPRNRLEEIAQREVVKYLDEKKREFQDPVTFKQRKVKYTAIPNSTSVVDSTGKKNYQELTKNTLDGLRKGLPDMFLIINKKPFFIEMKAPKGIVSEEQKEWIECINECEGIKAFVCYSAQEAIQIINSYIFAF
jgi:hypothetical protein